MSIRYIRPTIGALAIGITLVCFAAMQSSALAQYRAVGGITQNVGGSFVPIDDYDISGIVDAGGQVNYDEAPGEPNPSYHAQADSEAGYGLLRAHAFSQLIKPQPSASGFTISQTASGTAYATFTDIVISGPAAAFVPVTLNLHLSGAHTVISQETPGDSVHASSSVQVGVLFNDSNIGGGDHAIQSIDGDLMSPNASGMLENFDGDDVLNTPYFYPPVNTPFSIRLQLTAFASIQAYWTESFFVAANSDFGNTLSFPTSGPVFNLPDGYTVNSSQAFIEDNSFVPEPNSAIAVLTFAAGLTRRRRRHVMNSRAQGRVRRRSHAPCSFTTSAIMSF